ncbi:hypothetical protein BDQ17DRAFT_1329280 [Cyathus striatus]|nr:hypothetical protein BDQ17DRAFT_1329280 [Cyathus striatus]
MCLIFSCLWLLPWWRAGNMVDVDEWTNFVTASNVFLKVVASLQLVGPEPVPPIAVSHGTSHAHVHVTLVWRQRDAGYRRFGFRTSQSPASFTTTTISQSQPPFYPLNPYLERSSTKKSISVLTGIIYNSIGQGGLRIQIASQFSYCPT